MKAKHRPSSRDRLIKAAADLFYGQGIHRTSVDAVVAEAGLTKPTLYKHFPSKDDLVAAVAEYRSRNWHRVLESRIAAATTPHGRLLAVFQFLEDFVGEKPFRGCALVNASVEIPCTEDPSRQIIRQNKQANEKRIERLAFEAGLSDPKTLASVLSLLFEGAIVTAFVTGDTSAGRIARETAEKLILSRQ